MLHNGNVKLGDFGFCKALMHPEDLSSTMVGSPIYMAPEILKG
jgi:serine/threonine-protein kinase ULK/ATG1